MSTRRDVHVNPFGPFVPGTERLGDASNWQCSSNHLLQLSFKLFAGKALTTFDAGLAPTFFISPNIIFVQAGLAGLCLSFSLAMPGRFNCPLFCSAAAATSARAATTPDTSFRLSPVCSLTASKTPDFVNTAPAFLAFMAFAFIAFMGFAFIGFPFMAFAFMAFAFMAFIAAAFIAFMAFIALGNMVAGVQFDDTL